MKAKRRRTYMDEIAAEPVAMIGCPGIIVTRGYLYEWAVRLGYPKIGGFGSADYMAFGRKTSTEPLTDLTQPWVISILAALEEGS